MEGNTSISNQTENRAWIVGDVLWIVGVERIFEPVVLIFSGAIAFWLCSVHVLQPDYNSKTIQELYSVITRTWSIFLGSSRIIGDNGLVELRCHAFNAFQHIQYER
jgi:hypothetical protein